MRALLRPLPRAVTRPVSILLMMAWVAVMAILINRSCLQASSSLATDLARYGSGAVWRGVYYRGEKIGFTVSQTVQKDEGFELEEQGRLQMSLLGATNGETVRTTAHADADRRAARRAPDADPHRRRGFVRRRSGRRRAAPERRRPGAAGSAGFK